MASLFRLSFQSGLRQGGFIAPNLIQTFSVLNKINHAAPSLTKGLSSMMASPRVSLVLQHRVRFYSFYSASWQSRNISSVYSLGCGRKSPACNPFLNFPSHSLTYPRHFCSPYSARRSVAVEENSVKENDHSTDAKHDQYYINDSNVEYDKLNREENVRQSMASYDTSNYSSVNKNHDPAESDLIIDSRAARSQIEHDDSNITDDMNRRATDPSLKSSGKSELYLQNNTSNTASQELFNSLSGKQISNDSSRFDKISDAAMRQNELPKQEKIPSSFVDSSSYSDCNSSSSNIGTNDITSLKSSSLNDRASYDEINRISDRTNAAAPSEQNGEMGRVGDKTNMATTSEQNEKLEVEEAPEKMGLFKRFHHTYKQYGKILVVVHCATSTVWTALFYYTAMSGVDVEPILRWLGAGDTIVSFYTMPGVGNAAVAYLFYKLATPLRYPVTIAGTHLAVKYMRRWGYLPPVPESNTLRSLMNEGRSQMKDKYHQYHDQLEDQVKERHTEYQERWNEYKDHLGDQVKERRTEYKERWNEYKDHLGDQVKERRTEYQERWNEYKDHLGDQVKERRTEYKERWNEYKDHLGDQVKERRTEYKERWNEYKERRTEEKEGLRELKRQLNEYNEQWQKLENFNKK